MKYFQYEFLSIVSYFERQLYKENYKSVVVSFVLVSLFISYLTFVWH